MRETVVLNKFNVSFHTLEAGYSRLTILGFNTEDRGYMKATGVHSAVLSAPEAGHATLTLEVNSDRYNGPRE